VCTAVNVTSVDLYTLEVCLAVDDTKPACASSSSQGRLRAVFMDSQGFGASDPGDLSIEDGTIQLNRPYCKIVDPTLALLACQGQSVSGVAYESQTRFNQAFTVRNAVTWSGTRRASLGCFYVKRVDGLAFAPPTDGWSLGFTYSDTETGRKAVSAAQLCKSNPDPVEPVCPLSNMLVDKSRLKRRRLAKDPDDAYSRFHAVCTRLNVTRVDHRKFQVCLQRVTSSFGVCKRPVVSGVLAGVFFDSAAFGVTRARDLTFENGTIKIATPICLSSTSGLKKQGRVERCGPGPHNNLGLWGKSSLVLDVGLTVVETKAWSSTGSSIGTAGWSSTSSAFDLGCFYVTGPNDFKPEALAKGWSVALRYNDVAHASKSNVTSTGGFLSAKRKTYAVMTGKLCKQPRK
jgi:hypothetical protein